MRIENIISDERLAGEARHRGRSYEQVSVRYAQLAQYEAEGWKELKRGVHKIQLRREKKLASEVEDRVWMVLYRMGFLTMSGEGGAQLVRSDDEGTINNQIDVLALDDETGIVVECKSSLAVKRYEAQDAIHKIVNVRNSVRESINREAPRDQKRKFGSILVAWNLVPTGADLDRARQEKILILDKKAIEYYEKLVQVLGPAARYQLLAEIFANQEIEGLRLTLPAVEARLGARKVYTFAILPEELIKIAFVAHSTRRDAETYQRMVSKPRLKGIREFIEAGNVFPTNIVINFNGIGSRGESGLRFEPANQGPNPHDKVKYGWLTLPARYKSAWIIDGQHRLMAFAGHEWATKTALIVTAFDGMDAADQAQMFVDINSEQRKVSPAQILELQATLNEDSNDPRALIASVVSRTVQNLGKDADSPFFNRILLAEEPGDDERSITIKAFSDYLRRGKLFISSEIKKQVVQYGPLWAGSYDATLRRTRAVINHWFVIIKASNEEQWATGRGPGGLVAMNTGVSASIDILRNATDHLKAKGHHLIEMPNTELNSLLKPYAQRCAEFYAQLSPTDRDAFRSRYGSSGPAELARMLQDYIHASDESFEPEGLQKWRDERAEHKVIETQRLVSSIEKRLHDSIIETLKSAYGEQWWPEVPIAIRKAARNRQEEDTEDHPVETYFNLIDYREIVTKNWQMFQSQLAKGNSGNKDVRTEWMTTVNLTRNKANHASGARLTMTDYEVVKEIDEWMRSQGL